MTEQKKFVWKLTWYPKGADPKAGEVKTCVRHETLIGAATRLMEHYTKDGESYCVLVGAEIVGEWLLDQSVEIAPEPRFCVKCGRRAEILGPAHVYSCDGPGDAANPAPFVE